MVIFKKTEPQFHNLRKRKRNYLKKRYSKEEDCLRFNTCTTWSYRPGLRSKLLTQRSWSYPYV